MNSIDERYSPHAHFVVNYHCTASYFNRPKVYEVHSKEKNIKIKEKQKNWVEKNRNKEYQFKTKKIKIKNELHQAKI